MFNNTIIMYCVYIIYVINNLHKMFLNEFLNCFFTMTYYMENILMIQIIRSEIYTTKISILFLPYSKQIVFLFINQPTLICHKMNK